MPNEADTFYHRAQPIYDAADEHYAMRSQYFTWRVDMAALRSREDFESL